MEEEDEERRAGGAAERKGRVGEEKVEMGSRILGFSRVISGENPLPSTDGPWDGLWGEFWGICGPRMAGKGSGRGVIVAEKWASWAEGSEDIIN